MKPEGPYVKPWVKIHAKTLHDYQVAQLPDSSWRRYHECILFAQEERNNAIIEGRPFAEGFLPELGYMAWTLHMTADALRDDLARLALAGLVELRAGDDGRDRWYVTSFAASQANPTDAERKQQSRETGRARQSTRPPEPPEPPDFDDTPDCVTDVSQDVTKIKSKNKSKSKKEREEGEGEESAAAGVTVVEMRASSPNLSPPPVAVPEPSSRPEPQASRPARPTPSAPRAEPPPTIYGEGERLLANAPPAVALMARLTATWPGVSNTDYLVERLGDEPNAVLLEQAVKFWRGAGHRVTNYGGICDWYDELCADTNWTPAARFRKDRKAEAAVRVQPTSTKSYLY